MKLVAPGIGWCGKCKRSLTIDNFGLDNSQKNKRCQLCKRCRASNDKKSARKYIRNAEHMAGKPLLDARHKLEDMRLQKEIDDAA